jgi:hypothetical protein
MLDLGLGSAHDDGNQYAFRSGVRRCPPEAAIVSTLSAKNLRCMVQSVQVLVQPELIVPLSRQLSASHYVNLLPLSRWTGLSVRLVKKPHLPNPMH